jgi:histone deacetylase 11
MVTLVYSPDYDIHFFGLERLHPFDSRKYSRAMGELERRCGPRLESWIRTPEGPVTREQLLRVHLEEYLERLGSSPYLARVLELPFLAGLPASLIDQRVLAPMRLATAGTILAARQALLHGIAINMSGGYHHASTHQGEGFCVYSDLPIAVAELRATGELGPEDRVLVIDLDAHQGNGFERALGHDRTIFFLDVYNADIYPGDRAAARRIDFPAPLRPGTGDEEYLATLRRLLPEALDHIFPLKLALYNAGADVYRGAALGGLDIAAEGVFARDRYVFDTLSDEGIAWVMLLSGGYSRESYRLIARSVAYVLETWGADRVG